ncbi:MAG: hypothetical protein R2744_07620 [Bacteroidales bacterium]
MDWIYSARLVNGRWSSPALLPEPINSRANDFSYIVEDGSSDGFLPPTVTGTMIFTITVHWLSGRAIATTW